LLPHWPKTTLGRKGETQGKDAGGARPEGSCTWTMSVVDLPTFPRDANCRGGGGQKGRGNVAQRIYAFVLLGCRRQECPPQDNLRSSRGSGEMDTVNRRESMRHSLQRTWSGVFNSCGTHDKEEEKKRQKGETRGEYQGNAQRKPLVMALFRSTCSFSG